MKTTGTQTAVRSHRRPPSRRLWSRISRPGKKYRLPANVTGEDDWEVDVPQIRMSRAFGVMLVLHLVAVGGLFAFHMFGRDDHARQQEENQTAALDAVPAPATPVSAPVTETVKAAAPQPAPLREIAVAPPALPASLAEKPEEPAAEEPAPAPRGYIQHTIRRGESRELLASTYQISVKELVAANPKSKFTPGAAVNIPPPRKKIISAVDPVVEPVEEPELLEPDRSAGIMRAGFATSKSGEEKPLQAAQVSLRSPETARQDHEEAEGVETPAGRRENSGASRTESSSRNVASSKPKPSSRVAEETVSKKKEAPKASSAPVKMSGGTRSHVVQKGDTVYNLARHYSLSVNDVLKYNNITDPSRLQLGQVLKIPVRR